MHRIISYLKFSIIALLAVAMQACDGNDDGGSQEYDIVGTWTGERVYYNPASGNKSQYLYITFNRNGTGELEYESPVSVSAAVFNYTVSAGKVTCKGAWANSYGDTDADFDLTLRISGEALIPQGQYSEFVLTRSSGGNRPVEPGGSKDDYTELLKKVWVEENGESVLNITSDALELYTVNANNEYTYYSEIDQLPYDAASQTLGFEATRWNITECSSAKLALSANGYTHKYKAGNKSDIPTTPDLRKYLPYVSPLYSSDSKYCLVFESNGDVTYFERSGKYVTSITGSKVEVQLIATGKYSAQGSTVNCDFTSVSWNNDRTAETKDMFPGWTPRTPCSKKIKITAYSPLIMQVTLPNGAYVLMK